MTQDERIREDFRAFLWLVWKHLGLPEPTPVQLDIAHYLQHGPRRKVIEAFRGVGKSWITSAFALWNLHRDPNMKILVVSASKERADAFSTFTKRLIWELPFLQYLKPDPNKGDRTSNVAFDVRPATPAHAPSVKSVGITGQMAGSRADLIIPDDIEVPNNSETVTQREKLLIRVAEMGGAILTPEAKAGEKGGVVFLGTPQIEDSLYTKLEERGYEIRVWPSEIPKNASKYHGALSPFIQNMIDAGVEPGTPVDPRRFDATELLERQLEYGRAGYALQFLLDTSLSDADRYALKLRDFIVTASGVSVAPNKVVWGGGPDQVIDHLPLVGLTGDRFHRAAWIEKDAWSPYEGAVMYVDPSGRGKDQVGFAIVKHLHGMLFLRKWGGLEGGYSPETLAALATMARDEQVGTIMVEDNFGDGMFSQLLKPVVARIYASPPKDTADKKTKKEIEENEPLSGCRIEDEKVSGQKEVRILKSIEPVLAGHRLVIDEELVRDLLRDKTGARDPEAVHKSPFYQLTRLTTDRGSLKFDDAVEALAGACRYFTLKLAADVDERMQDRKDEQLQEMLDKFMENASGRKIPARTWGRVTTQ